MNVDNNRQIKQDQISKSLTCLVYLFQYYFAGFPFYDLRRLVVLSRFGFFVVRERHIGLEKELYGY